MQKIDSLHKIAIRRSFNRGIDSYDKNCGLQYQVGLKLINLISQVKLSYTNIIDLGCGSGLVTEQCALRFNYHQFDAIDIAEHAIVCAGKKLDKYAVNTYQADFDSYSPEIQFDLVFANMSLQWSLNLFNTINKINHVQSENAIFAFSVPVFGTFSELAEYARNNFYQPAVITHFLSQHKFNILHHHVDTTTIYYDSHLSALGAIKEVGANYIMHKMHRGLRGKSYLSQIISSASLTYNIAYFIVR